MVKVYVNGQDSQATLEQEQTIGDVLKSFELTCEQNNAAVIGITVDDKIITPQIFDEEAAKPLGKDTKFEFSVITEQTVKESFIKLSEYFDNLSAKMEEIPVAIQKVNNKEVIESINTLADGIDEFCHVAAWATLFPNTFTRTKLDGKDFKDFFNEFSPVLLDFEQAIKNNDLVSIGDLSEYEICPRLKAISESLKQM